MRGLHVRLAAAVDEEGGLTDEEGGLQQQRHPALPEESVSKPIDSGHDADLGLANDTAAEKSAMDRLRDLSAVARAHAINESTGRSDDPGFSPRGSGASRPSPLEGEGASAESPSTDQEAPAGTFDPPFPNHTIMHGAGKFGLASLRNLDQLPPTGAVVIAAPLKIVHGSGSPLRVVAIAPVQ